MSSDELYVTIRLARNELEDCRRWARECATPVENWITDVIRCSLADRRGEPGELRRAELKVLELRMEVVDLTKRLLPKVPN
jgi:hypothetical protein